MKIQINQTIESESDIILIALDADVDVEINASLKSTAGKIIIFGNSVINNSSLNANGDCRILGRKLTKVMPESSTISLTGTVGIGEKILSPISFASLIKINDSEIFISSNLDKKIDIIK